MVKSEGSARNTWGRRRMLTKKTPAMCTGQFHAKRERERDCRDLFVILSDAVHQKIKFHPIILTLMALF